MRTLDIGCGFLQEYHKKREGIGVDIQRGFCDVVADAEHLPFRDEVFEKVLMYALLEHLTHPTRCLSEARRVGKPNAKYEMTFPLNPQRRINFKHVFLEFPFSLKRSVKILNELQKDRSGALSHKSKITPNLIESFLSLEEVINMEHPHAWFCGKKGRLLLKLFAGRTILLKDQGLYIQARKNPK